MNISPFLLAYLVLFPLHIIKFTHVLGNPGNDGFYTDFGRRLIRNLIAREERLGTRRVQFVFYTLSHLNHVLLPTSLRCSESHKVNGMLTFFFLSKCPKRKAGFWCCTKTNSTYLAEFTPTLKLNCLTFQSDLALLTKFNTSWIS